MIDWLIRKEQKKKNGEKKKWWWMKWWMNVVDTNNVHVGDDLLRHQFNSFSFWDSKTQIPSLWIMNEWMSFVGAKNQIFAWLTFWWLCYVM